MNLYAKLVVNSFCLFDEHSRTLIGEAIYLRSAMFNHHCEPNCSFIYNGKTMEIRTLRDIKPGEECFIHYVKVLHPINMRRQELFKNYKFWCDCARCQREFQSLSSAELNARVKIEEMESKAFSSIAKVDNEFDGNFYKMFEDCETALNSIQDELEPTNPAIGELYMKYQEACIGLHRWKEAAQSGMAIIEACKTHLIPTDPMLGFHLWRVAKIQAKELNQPIAAIDLLQQAIDVMSIAYGSTHPMTIEAKEILETIIVDQ